MDMESLMEDIDAEFKQVKLLESFISLHLRRDRINPQLRALVERIEEVKLIISECNQFLEEEYHQVKQDYKDLTQKLHSRQLQMMDFVIKKQQESSQQLVACRTPRRCLTDLQQNSSQICQLSSVQKIAPNNFLTPSMTLRDYAQSPFIKKTRPVPKSFQFLDFEVTITAEMFESIPKYLKGRETLASLIEFLNNWIIASFNEKYRLYYRARECIQQPQDLELWRMYKDQKSYFPGVNFITQGDISRTTQKLIDKKSLNRIAMIRHLGIIQEQRKGQTVCYIWTANNISL